MGNRLRAGVRNAGRTALLIVVLFVVALGAEQITLLRDFDAYLAAHADLKGRLVTGLIGLAVIGGALLIGAQFLPEPRRPPWMSPRDTVTLAPPITFVEAHGRGSRWFGRGFAGEASFAATKEAWRTGAWRYSRPWRLLFVMALGAAFLLVGLFGLPIVLGPPLVKLLCAGTLLYALVRATWAFWRA